MFYKETNFKETPIGKIPKDWKVVRIGDIAQTSSGGTPNRAKREYYGGNIPWVKSSELKDNVIYDTEEKITEEGLQNSSAKIFPKGTLLIAMYGATVGKTGILGIDATTNQAICAILPNKTFDPHFLKNYIIFRRNRLISISSGGAQPNISQEIIKAFKIPLPPIKEQQKIAEILSTIDEAIQRIDEVIAKTERLKKGLMQELLTKGLVLGFMFDTTVFNAILNRHVDMGQLPRNLKYYVTHIQYDEILNTKDERRRGELLKIFEKVQKDVVPTKGCVVGVSKVDLSELFSEDDANLYDKMLEKLKEKDKKSGKKKPPENQARDILIALTCMKNCLTLVTNDENLKEVAQEFQCPAIKFCQLLKGEYREFKDTEIGRIPREWDVVKLSDKKLAEIIMGQSPSSSTYNKEGKGLPFLQGKMEFGEVYPSPIMYCSQPIKIAEPNDILISVRAPVGDVNIAPYKLCIGRGLAAIRFNLERASHWFYFYYFQKIKDFLENLGKGSTFKAITKEDLENLKVPYPSLFEQQRIAEILLSIDKKLEIERNEKAKLERIKQGFMDLLLTGKIRVKV
jgi:restriction endonuclease S subunit/predicted nucleic acid-binding protein